MSNAVVYDELDLAVEKILSSETLDADLLDPLVRDLLPLAEDLGATPRPEFRSELLAALSEPARSQVVPIQAKVLPSLFPQASSGMRGLNFAASAALHAAAFLLLATSGLWMAREVVRKHVLIADNTVSTLVAPPSLSEANGGGGGGDRDHLDASRGDAPRFDSQQITPPAIVLHNDRPKLTAEPTVIGPPDVQLSRVGNTGDPLSTLFALSNGTGIGGGIGSGDGTGVGSGRGAGVGPGYGGGFGGGIYRVGKGVSAPRAIYDPEPQYTDEARKAKVQGVVVLAIIVGPDGIPRNPTLQRSLGMGLDEKALDAVKTWRFEPARKNGRPVSVMVSVEVNFHLY